MSADAPVLSVIVPVYDAEATFESCLQALRASTFRDFELVVVDDGSRDGSAAVAEREAVDQLLRQPANQGPAAARNRAAAAARGRILFFTDADVCVAPDTLERVVAAFREPGVECVIGSYGVRQPHASLPTAYKNAWIHHSYARSGPEVDWFFTAVGAVTRDAFLRVGGFVTELRREGGGSDVEFGRRLRASGVRIRLDPSLCVTHLRRFTVGSLLGNDYRRAAGWTRMMLNSPGGLRDAARHGVANVSRGFAAGAALALVSGLSLPFAALGVRGRLLLALSIGAQLWLDRAFLGFAWRTFGAGHSVGFALLGLLDRAACALGILRGVLANGIRGWGALRSDIMRS
jgi:GT2 family glycosyltransferase